MALRIRGVARLVAAARAAAAQRGARALASAAVPQPVPLPHLRAALDDARGAGTFKVPSRRAYERVDMWAALVGGCLSSEGRGAAMAARCSGLEQKKAWQVRC